jgi:hypothetical protein
MQTDNLIAAVAVGVVVAAGVTAAWMTNRQDPGDTAVAAAGQVTVSKNHKDVVTAPPLKAATATAPASGKAGAHAPGSAMGAAAACRDCGVVQMVVAVYGYGQQHRPASYQMHIRMDDGSTRTVQQRGALAAGSRVLLEGDTVRVLAESPPPG